MQMHINTNGGAMCDFTQRLSIVILQDKNI